MRRLICITLALVMWGVLLARALHTFGPDSVYVQPFNSDSALPVLMANDPKLDAFRTYIYGQDQIGAWPFVACQLFSRATGYVWTDRSIYVWQTVWLFLCAFALAGLARRAALVVPALFFATLCLHPAARHYIFVINQRNAWQVTALYFAWWSLRALCARYFTPAQGGARSVWWHLSTFVFSLLAVWTSPISAPALCVCYVLEVVRARLLARDSALRFTMPRVLKTFAPLAAALLCEQLLKANYHRFALKHFGTDYRTPLKFDWGNMLLNLRTQLALLCHSPWWPLPVLSALAAPCLAYCLARSVMRYARKEDGICQTDARLDLIVLALGATAVSLVNFATTVIFTWTRLNAYGPRYLALTHLFGAFAGLLTLLLLLSLSPRATAARRIVFPALAAAIVFGTLLLFPPARREPEYERLRGVAAQLAARAPGGVLLGGYWDTYVFAALEPAARFVPVPAEHQFVRTPWTPQLLRASPRVVVVHHVFPASGAPETPAPYDAFGDGQQPPPSITQHGATLRLAVPQWFARDGYVFSLYDNQSAPTR